MNARKLYDKTSSSGSQDLKPKMINVWKVGPWIQTPIYAFKNLRNKKLVKRCLSQDHTLFKMFFSLGMQAIRKMLTRRLQNKITQILFSVSIEVVLEPIEILTPLSIELQNKNIQNKKKIGEGRKNHYSVLPNEQEGRHFIMLVCKMVERLLIKE